MMHSSYLLIELVAADPRYSCLVGAYCARTSNACMCASQ